MPFNSSDFISGLAEKLTMYADDLGETIRQNAEQNNLPEAVGNSIEKDTVKVEGGNLSIEVRVGKDAPMAVAYEFGSGIHRTRGTPGLYPIRAKNAPELSFFWENRRKWFKGVELPYGHPGVAPRPFIVPAIEKIVPKMKQELGKEVKAILLIGTQQVTVIRA